MKTRTAELLTIDESSNASGTLMTVSGRIDIDSSPSLRDRILNLLQQESVRALTIDLCAVPYIDSSGLATLIEALRIARACQTPLLLKLHDRPRYLLEVTGLLHFFESPQNAEALAPTRIN